MQSSTLNKKLSPVPRPLLSLPPQIYSSLTTQFPVLADYSKKPLNKLCWSITLDFLLGKRQYQACSCYVRQITGSDKVRDLLAEAYNHLSEIASYDPDDYVTAYDVGRTEEPRCRVIYYRANDGFQQLKDSLKFYWVHDPNDPWIFIHTGKRQTVRAIKKTRKSVDKKYHETISLFNRNETLDGMNEYCDLVNKLVNNKARRSLIKNNYESARSVLIQLEANANQFLTLEKINNRLPNTYRLPSTISPRIFDGTDQPLNKQARRALYSGCIDLIIGQITGLICVLKCL